MAYSNTATPLTSFINGAFVQCDRSNGVLPVVNPATGETIAAAVAASDAEIDASFKAATAAQRAWGRQTAVQRGDVLRKWASLVERGTSRVFVVVAASAPLAHDSCITLRSSLSLRSLSLSLALCLLCRCRGASADAV